MAAVLQPSSPDASSLAAGVFAAAKNKQFVSGAAVLPRKIILIGTYNPALNPLADEEKLVLVTSAAEVGAKFGQGFNLHRLAIGAFDGSRGVETWVIPMDEAGGAVAAAGDVLFDGTATAAGVVNLYIGHDRVPVNIAKGDTSDNVATKVAAAVTAEADLPVLAVVDGVTTDQVNFTAKSKGVYGNFIRISFNAGFQEEFPAGVDAVSVTQPTGGVGVPGITDALNAMGTGDNRNEKYFTDGCHGFTNDTTTISAIDDYVGPGNDFVGCYSKTIARPLRFLDGSVSNDLGGLITLTDTVKEVRAAGLVWVPTSISHPSEFAASAIGIMARINNNRAEESYIDQPLPKVIAGGVNALTNQYANRDTAVKNGISPTLNQNGAVVLQNVVSFYRPDDVPVASNGYRSMRNISIIQNMLFNVKLNFSQEKWEGISIVADTAKVSNSISREKARDISSVIDDLLALTLAFERFAWIFTAAFTISKLQEGGLVTIRPGGTGFNSTLPVIFSGEGGILDTVVEFDTSLDVLLP